MTSAEWRDFFLWVLLLLREVAARYRFLRPLIEEIKQALASRSREEGKLLDQRLEELQARDLPPIRLDSPKSQPHGPTYNLDLDGLHLARLIVWGAHVEPVNRAHLYLELPQLFLVNLAAATDRVNWPGYASQLVMNANRLFGGHILSIRAEHRYETVTVQTRLRPGVELAGHYERFLRWASVGFEHKRGGRFGVAEERLLWAVEAAGAAGRRWEFPVLEYGRVRVALTRVRLQMGRAVDPMELAETLAHLIGLVGRIEVAILKALEVLDQLAPGTKRAISLPMMTRTSFSSWIPITLPWPDAAAARTALARLYQQGKVTLNGKGSLLQWLRTYEALVELVSWHAALEEDHHALVGFVPDWEACLDTLFEATLEDLEKHWHRSWVQMARKLFQDRTGASLRNLYTYFLGDPVRSSEFRAGLVPSGGWVLRQNAPGVVVKALVEEHFLFAEVLRKIAE